MQNRAARARKLAKGGEYDAAEAIFAELAAEFPKHQTGFIGLARIAALRGDWPRAVATWEELFHRFGEKVTEAWFIARARALHKAGRPDDATEMARSAILRFPKSEAASTNYTTHLIEYLHHDRAREEAERGLLMDQPNAARAINRFRVYHWLKDIEAARAIHTAAIPLTARVQQLEYLFEMVPLIFERWDRIAQWQLVEERLAVQPPDPTDTRGIRATLGLRLCVALRDHAGFLAIMHAGPTLQAPWDRWSAHHARMIESPGYPDFGRDKIFCIGLTKTGTSSLNAALDILGYRASHFRNDFTHTILDDDDAFALDAMTDTPVCAMFEKLYFLFPRAKFIYTVRVFDEWKISFEKYFCLWHGTAEFSALRKDISQNPAPAQGTDFAKVHRSLYYNHPDARTAYHAFDARVRSFFADKPPGKLLHYDIFAGDGWHELCRFLGRDVPDLPYPWENRSVEG